MKNNKKLVSDHKNIKASCTKKDMVDQLGLSWAWLMDEDVSSSTPCIHTQKVGQGFTLLVWFHPESELTPKVCSIISRPRTSNLVKNSSESKLKIHGPYSIMDVERHPYFLPAQTAYQQIPLECQDKIH